MKFLKNNFFYNKFASPAWEDNLYNFQDDQVHSPHFTDEKYDLPRITKWVSDRTEDGAQDLQHTDK